MAPLFQSLFFLHDLGGRRSERKEGGLEVERGRKEEGRKRKRSYGELADELVPSEIVRYADELACCPRAMECYVKRPRSRERDRERIK